jgi:NhaC family Na+:H+ antiporter
VHPIAALAPLLTLLGSFVLGSLWTEGGGELLLVCLGLAAAVAVVQARRVGCGWAQVEEEVGQRLAEVLPALIILLSIGALIGSWMAAGTIPGLVLVGLRLVSPEQLALTAFLGTATMSLVTGTSWGSAGTIGVALMGVAHALGASLPLIAGAVVSGAYFGDKLSPLSDTTNVCAIAARTPLYTHIKNLLFTALPSFAVAALVYGLWPQGAPPPGAEDGAQELAQMLEGAYRVDLWVGLPPALLLLGMVGRKPAAPVMLVSSLAAVAVASIHQELPLKHALASLVSGFDSSFLAGRISGASAEKLLSRGGLYSMAPTLVVVFTAFVLTAGMQLSGALETIIRGLQSMAKSVFGVIAATMASGSIMVGLTSHGMVTALVVGDLFRETYREHQLAPENLSRTLEDSVTIVEPLLPWTVSALYMSSTLDVTTLEYLPHAVFCWSGGVFTLWWAAAHRLWPRALPRLAGTAPV